jgi:hypothetical protein
MRSGLEIIYAVIMGLELHGGDDRNQETCESYKSVLNKRK